ncbi:hypothetical protein KHQ81_11370 [Mycoplasmatota bacterium]|nr:hypothetical protein KHQ81_11370 [Mycoplasmatota bacterium]
MKHRKKRISKITEELINYFFKIGATQIHIDVIEENNQFKVIFQSNIKDIKQDDIDILVKCLNCQKLEEMEEYYWELTGECDTDTELSIVGMMIDDFEVNIKDDQMELIIYRNKIKRRNHLR